MPSRERYARTLARLYALVPRGMVLGLDTMRAALAARGNLHDRIPCVHIAGTNGKGSVAAMVAQGLHADGYRVGLYSSPHLQRFAERFRIDGKPVSEDLLGGVLEALLGAMDAGELPGLTFFETATLAAWEVFARAGVDRVVLEVGLGGRLDATNVCAPAITAITRIALDHEALLGSTLREIAGEKAGILKRNVRCVLGPSLAQGEAREAIELVAKRVGSPLVDAPPLPDDTESPVLRGAFQRENAATASALLRALGSPEGAVRSALHEVQWPGRMEQWGNVLLDVAHNPDGVNALVSALDAGVVPAWTRGPRALVLGASRDKKWGEMSDALATRVSGEGRFFAAAAMARALEPSALVERHGGRACGSVSEALALARAHVGEGGAVLVCGSVFVVGEARAALSGEEGDPPVGL